MNILMLLSTDIPVCDGIASHVLGLAKRLRTRGYSITLMTRGDWQGIREFEYEGFRTIKVPFYTFYPFHVYFHGLFVREAIEALTPQPDLIHLHSPLVPAVPKKWPIVTTFHTPMLVDTGYVENIGLRTFLIKLMGKTTSYWLEKKLLNISDAVITVSQGVADELRSYYGFSGTHLYLITNVVDTEFYKPDTHSTKEKKLLYVGRLAYRKGLFEIVKSASIVVKAYPDVKYVIVGSGPLENKIRKMVDRDNISLNFEFCGEIRDSSKIVQYYQNAYAVLFPSYYEGCPIALLEAMACGKPVISTNASFTKGILEDGLNAILIKPKSAEELAKATIKLLSSEELCKSLGEAARKTAVEKMNPDLNTNKVEEVYKYAIDKFKKARRC